MSKTILVCGLGPGISAAVADKFAAEGFSLALVSRSQDKVDAAAKAFVARGVKAQGFAADSSSADAVRAVVENVRAALGPIAAIHWNAYGSGAGDLLATDKRGIDGVLDVAVVSLLAAVQSSLPDLRAQKGAVLVTNGGLGYFDPGFDAMAVQWKAAGLAIANSAKHKLVGLLAQQLKADGIYVGEVCVLGTVKGTAWDQGNATIEPSTVAAKFWELHQGRSVTYAEVKG